MRVLVLAEDNPLTRNGFGGVCAVIYGHLEALAAGGHTIDLVLLGGTANPGAFERYTIEQPETWAEVQSWLASVTTIPVSVATARTRAASLRLVFTDRDRLLVPRIDEHWLGQVSEVVAQKRPDLVLAEHRIPAMLAMRSTQCPVVFSHMDWEWRLMVLRKRGVGRSARRRALQLFTRLSEIQLVRRAAACVCVSASEAQDIRRLGGKATYIPVTYDPIPPDEPFDPSDRPRLVHLGGMAATASREGLIRFLDVVMPEVTRTLGHPPELVVVGDMNNAPASLRSALDRIDATQTGFVADLTAVLRPGDIAVVPWEHDTGARTKVALLMRHGQVVVAVKEGVACMPEAARALVTVDALHSMSDAIVDLLGAPQKRATLAREAQNLFTNLYTNNAVAPQLNDWLADASEAATTAS